MVSDQCLERKNGKQRKEEDTQGGHIAPITVPSTPRGELGDIFRKVVQAEANKEMKFKVIETGGRTVKSLLQRSNPTAIAGCTAQDCISC